MSLDWHLTSDAPEVRRAVQTIYERVLSDAAIYGKRPKNPHDVRRAIEVVLLNLFIAYFHQPERYVFYPRGKEVIGRTPLAASAFLKVVEALGQLQLLENIAGERGSGLYDDETGRQLRSRMRGTAELFALLQECGIRIRMIRSTRDFALVRLKNSEKEPIELPTDRASQQRIKAMRANLEIINGTFERSLIGLHVTDTRLRQINERLSNDKDKSPLNFARKKLYRVFNKGSLERGGRFVGGWWQDVPSEDRPHIYMGGPDSYYAKFTAECDYSSMFPSIAYGLMGHELDDSAYQLDGVEQPKPIRKVVKRTLLAMLMEDNPDSVRKAVHKALSDEAIKSNPQHAEVRAWNKKNRGRTYMLPFEDCAPQGCPLIPDLIKAIEKQHEPLCKDFLYKPDMGLYLMFKETQIAERVMLDMAEQGAPVLPIHDSFIAMTSWVGYEHEHDHKTGVGGWLDTAMRRAFKAELGVETRVTFDYREPETEDDQEPKWTVAKPIEELFAAGSPTSGETREDYDTFNRHHDDWYEDKGKEPAETIIREEDIDELDR